MRFGFSGSDFGRQFWLSRVWLLLFLLLLAGGVALAQFWPNQTDSDSSVNPPVPVEEVSLQSGTPTPPLEPLTTAEVETILTGQPAPETSLGSDSNDPGFLNQPQTNETTAQNSEAAASQDTSNEVELPEAGDTNETWTTETFPGLELTYPGEWSLTQNELPSEFSGLSDYELTLTRDEASLRVYLYPLRAGGCPDEVTRETPTGYTTTNGFQEYRVSGEESPYVVQYDEGIPECVYDTLVQSSLSTAGLGEANAENGAWIMDQFGLTQAQYVAVIEGEVSTPDNSLLEEIRRIVSQSTFE